MNLEAEFQKHAPFLRALARRLAIDAATADDLVQDTCTEALTAERGGAVPARHPIAWLTHVLRIRAARHVRGERRRRAREQVAAPQGALDPASMVERLEVARRLLQHVEALDDHGREVIYLRYYEDLAPRQIATRLALPVATVKTRLARALARLRERLDADDPSRRREWLPALAAIGGVDFGAAAAAKAAVFGPVWLPWLAALLLLAVTAVVLRPLFVAAPTPPDAASLVQQPTEPAPASPTPAPGDARSGAVAATNVVLGRVEDAGIGAAVGTGTPARDVLVRARLSPPMLATTNRREPPRLETTTDAAGQFRFELPADARLLGLEAVGDRTMDRATWSTATHGPLPDPLVLTRRLRGALTGVVVDPTGACVPDVRVLLTHRDGDRRVETATTSDAAGRFAFADVPKDPWLGAERDGFVQVGASVPRPSIDGGYDEARIVLAPAGTLVVDVVDAAGAAPRSIQGVGVQLSEAESGLAAQTRFGRPFREMAPLRQGRAEILVPAGVQLVLWAGDTIRAEVEGRGVVDATRDGTRPIVVAARERKALRVVLGTDTVIRGVVVDGDGKPVPNASVWFEQITNGSLGQTGMLDADREGRFEHAFVALADRVPVLVHASGSGAHRAAQWVDVAGTQPAAVELRLEPASEIVGTVRDAEGRPVAARIHMAYQAPGSDRVVTAAGYRSSDKQGRFRIPALPAPRRLTFETDAHEPVTVDRPVADGEALDVVLTGRRSLLRLRVTADAALAGVEVRVHRLAAAGTSPWPELGPETRWSHATAPPEAVGAAQVHRRPPNTEGTIDVPLTAGPAWIAVSGTSTRYTSLTRLASGPVTVREGETTVTLTLAATAECHGRVEFSTPGPHAPLAVAIADDAGRLLAVGMPGLDDTWDTVHPVASQGAFALSSIPCGAFELRLGSADELRRGDARLRRRIVTSASRTEPILLRW
jgi:RNA polymerase sigma factor (sigma-70 family)